MHRTCTARALLAVVALTCAGCLDFDRQTVYAVFPQGRDELHALLIYEGLRVFGSDEQSARGAQEELRPIVERAQEELRQIVEGKSFYLGDLTHKFNLDGKEGSETEQKIGALLAKHISIQNGVLFLDDKANLNACQSVRIGKLSAFVEALNQLLTAEFARMAAEKRASPTNDDFFDPDTLASIDRAIQDRHVWLKCEPGRFSFTLPASRAATDKMKRRIAGMKVLNEVNAMAQKLEAEHLAAFKSIVAATQRYERSLVGLPWSFEQGRGRFTISLGVGEGEPLHLPIECSLRLWSWQGGLVNFAKEAQLPLRKDLTVNGLIEKLQREVKEMQK